ncbi:MAG: UDP-N-acetylglucosamine 1-carboxyvinyltransferase [Alphaproteobacteria bacterium]|nr:UDP-N-acetylglucosamine 1-carboxyvinyltransferase [Alphaproteobacteria bacterium]MDE2012080.1 UDP-N-acetylglucosamine 1-carboxyvinyltransferase [Alphaproteobacteria bacterium]MDE2073377.1 UDP-N-acetylglucosamine 1-carboxyvinyltransferase [Alphaproteobacteria bacterium]
MDRIRIRGGARLRGEIPISGAKNAALKLMAASLLTDEPLTLTNVPALVDVAFMAELLRSFGVAVELEPGTRLGEGGRLSLCAARLTSTTAEYDIVRKMRASFQVLGPLLARHGEAKVSLPGGCAIGARPVDFHIKGFEALGARIDLADGYVLARAPEGLTGATYEMPFASVGATENLMTGAALARGRTVLKNVAREPETQDLGHCLIAMGARISGLGTSEIVIDGVERLNGIEYKVMPDRIETGTYAIATAIAGGEVELVGARAENVGALIGLLEKIGTEVAATKRGFAVHRNGFRPISVDVVTDVYPAFPTDLQAQFMTLMAIAEGTSHIRETVFENRFMHVPELARMGADIHVEGDTAIVRGVPGLKGAPVMATDLRASSSLVLAGLAAEGETIVNRVYHLDRGFERLEEKLSAVGAEIERLKA